MTPTPACDMDGLLARVRAATGPDRALSAAIHHALLGKGTPYFDTLHSTASVDTALALVDRVLPGRSVAMNTGDGTMPHAVIAATWMEQAPTLPLAILLALLTSLKDAS